MPPADENFGSNLLEEPLFEPTFFNVDVLFGKVVGIFKWFKESGAGATIHLVSNLITIFGITITIYAIVRLLEIQKEEHGHLKHEIHEAIEKRREKAEAGKNMRWEHVQDLINSPNASDWKVAIIEASSILEGLLRARTGMDYGSIGDMLKVMNPGDLGSMQQAWDATQLRNTIAHQGSAYDLTQREARRAVQQYEMVFRELGFLS